ncbi:MAG: hypothetical protein KAU50_05805 [Candidatus Marinimicrobia bacterium]|nr:hypothetical protein [Candidatus Neomarinimicrobiota bacterium]
MHSVIYFGRDDNQSRLRRVYLLYAEMVTAVFALPAKVENIRLVRDQALKVTFALLASLIVAAILIPTLRPCSQPAIHKNLLI